MKDSLIIFSQVIKYPKEINSLLIIMKRIENIRKDKYLLITKIISILIYLFFFFYFILYLKIINIIINPVPTPQKLRFEDKFP